MDPTVVLRDIREQIKAYEALAENDLTDTPILRTADHIIDNITALDEWISKGGHAPADWPLVGMARS